MTLDKEVPGLRRRKGLGGVGGSPRLWLRPRELHRTHTCRSWGCRISTNNFSATDFAKASETTWAPKSMS